MNCFLCVEMMMHLIPLKEQQKSKTVQLRGTAEYICLFGWWFPRGMWPVGGLPGRVVVLFLVFKGIFTLFSIVAVSVYIPTTALFVVVRTWKQPRCPPAGKWIRKSWYTQNGVLLSPQKERVWVHWAGMGGRRAYYRKRVRKRKRWCVCVCIEPRKWCCCARVQGRNGDAGVEHGPVDTPGKERVERRREVWRINPSVCYTASWGKQPRSTGAQPGAGKASRVG